MTTYPIPADLLQAVANYLAERPWKEVNNLLQGINSAVAAASAPKDQENVPLPPVDQ